MNERRRGPLLATMLLAALVGCLEDHETVDVADALPPTSAVAEAPWIPPGVTEEQVELGRELYLPCAVCHGLDGEGNSLGPSLRDGEWLHIAGSLSDIEAIIRSGVPQPREYPVPMVPMGGGDYDAEELRAVAAYVYAISQPPPADGSGSTPAG